MLDWCWSSYFLRLWLICTEFLMETCRKSSLVLSFMVLSLLVIACAGLLQCWCSNILKTMIDRDKICIWDIFIMFETQNFYFCLTEWSSFCSATQPTSCWSDAGHHFTWDYDWFVMVFLYRYLGNHLWAINLWLLVACSWYDFFRASFIFSSPCACTS